MVDDILSKSDTPPIIIIQADYGPGMLTNIYSFEDTCLKERFSICGAYFLPGVDVEVLLDDLTPVNLFQIIFNEYFDADYELLPRHHYYVGESVYIFQNIDITDRVDTCQQ